MPPSVFVVKSSVNIPLNPIFNIQKRGTYFSTNVHTKNRAKDATEKFVCSKGKLFFSASSTDSVSTDTDTNTNTVT